MPLKAYSSTGARQSSCGPRIRALLCLSGGRLRPGQHLTLSRTKDPRCMLRLTIEMRPSGPGKSEPPEINEERALQYLG